MVDLVGLLAILSFSTSSTLLDIYIALSIFLSVYNVRSSLSLTRDVTSRVVSALQAGVPAGHSNLDSQNSYMFWQPIYYAALVTVFTALSSFPTFTILSSKFQRYGERVSYILTLLTLSTSVINSALYCFVYHRPTRFKLYILSIIRQAVFTEYWNFHFVDITRGEGRRKRLFNKYRILVLTNKLLPAVEREAEEVGVT